MRVTAMMPSASDSTASRENPGVRRRPRRPNRTSPMNCSSQVNMCVLPGCAEDVIAPAPPRLRATAAARGTVLKLTILSPPRAATGRPAMDERFMQIALELASQARQRGEVPVGAVFVLGGAVIGEGFNQPISAQDPTAHAEIVAMRQAAARLGNYRLTGAELFCTIEPLPVDRKGTR